MKSDRSTWYLMLSVLSGLASLAYLLLVSPVQSGGDLNSPVILGAIFLISLTSATFSFYLTRFFWSRRRAFWVGVFCGFLTVQILALSSLRLLRGMALVILVLFNLLFFWYMVRLVQD